MIDARRSDAPYAPYWGKADPGVSERTGKICHLAALHMLDVAAVAEGLVTRNAVLRSRLAGMLGFDQERVATAVAAFVALHDIGKFDARFQAKAPDVARRLTARTPPSGKFDHGSAGFGHLLRDLPDEVTRELGANAWPLLQAVTGHHGELPKRSDALANARWADPRWRASAAADRDARAGFFRDSLALFRARGASLVVEGALRAPAITLLAGLCAVADWIGSDAERFPYVDELPDLLAYYESHALPRANASLDSLSLRDAKPSARTFAALFPSFEPLGLQRVTSQMDLPAGPSLVVVEARMGSGKTEAALDLAERFLARGDASGFFFALPTMATSNAMLERLADVGTRMFEGRVNLVLSHGRRALNETFTAITQRRVTASPYEDEATVVCNRWLTGRKRALLGQIGVGTVDQAMLAALRVRHQFVRAYALSESVVVIDEVHAYDAYMQVILDRLIEWLGALGTPVVLLSATLPACTRRAFTEAYARGAGWSHPTGGDNSRAAAYPLVTVVSRNGVEARTSEAPDSPRVIALEHVSDAPLEPAVIPALAAAARDGAMVAWIRNTVTDAQRAWDAAQGSGVPTYLFHARMRASDRARAEAEVLRLFGKTGERRGALLIATQVVEQSLDLDFDHLVTDLCPLDLVLQRAGRLHRHPRSARPAGYERARLVIASPPAADAMTLTFGGSGFVYDRATLALTLSLLAERDALELPRDIRDLVERVYDPSLRAAAIAAAPNAEKLGDAESSAAKDRDARRAKAAKAVVPPASFDPRALEAAMDDDDEVVHALTRDGRSTTLLPVWWGDGVGGSLDGSDPWSLDVGNPDAWREARSLLEETVTVPEYPWERIERGARAQGESKDWGAWERRARDFLQATGLGDPVIVPMRRREDGTFRGWVCTTRGATRKLAYSFERGLWFLD